MDTKQHKTLKTIDHLELGWSRLSSTREGNDSFLRLKANQQSSSSAALTHRPFCMFINFAMIMLLFLHNKLGSATTFASKDYIKHIFFFRAMTFVTWQIPVMLFEAGTFS